MIGHQGIGAELKLVTHAVVVEQLQITAPIGIGTKNRLALIAARDHMIKRTGKVNSGFSRHAVSAITTTTINAKDK